MKAVIAHGKKQSTACLLEAKCDSLYGVDMNVKGTVVKSPEQMFCAICEKCSPAVLARVSTIQRVLICFFNKAPG